MAELHFVAISFGTVFSSALAGNSHAYQYPLFVFSFQVSSSEPTSLACIRAYHKIFSHYVNNGDLQLLPAEEVHSGNVPSQLYMVPVIG